jgi:O-antigen/teichoic acid export membrane protein
MAVVLPKEDKEGDNVAVVTLLSVVVTTLIFGILFLFWGDQILQLLKKSELSSLTGLIVTGIFFNGIYLSMQYLYIRHKEFGGLAKNRIVEAGFTWGGSVLFGFLKFDFMGMFISKISGVIISSILIIKNRGTDIFRNTTLKDVKAVISKYKKFPLVNTPMVLLNTLSLELPVFMISIFFDAKIIGLYALARKVLSLPLNIVGKSFSQVYLQAASEAYNQDRAKLLGIYLETVKKLSLIGIIPVIIAVFSPWIFRFVFGTEWEESGTFLQLMIFWLYFQFVNQPISTTYTIINKQEIGLLLVIGSVILKFTTMYFFSNDAYIMIFALSVVSGIFYIFFNILIYINIKKLET